MYSSKFKRKNLQDVLNEEYFLTSLATFFQEEHIKRSPMIITAKTSNGGGSGFKLPLPKIESVFSKFSKALFVKQKAEPTLMLRSRK